jgi:dienelactone hydrolase
MSLPLAAQSHLETGKIYPQVACKSDSNQTYALYLPTGYKVTKPSAAVFVFEPLARGRLPVSLMKDAAEKFGYIIIASNNSRNGPFRPQIDAAHAMWTDAHERFSIDPKRTYFAGFSGGARLAVTFTARCKECAAAGVMASGAAFPAGMEPKSVSTFLYFGAVGREDFNFPEYLEIEPKLRDAKFTFHISRFDGAHEWAPADVWLEAFEWLDLQATKSGALPKDSKFINEAYRRALLTASAQKNDLEKFRTYSQAANDFADLTDVSEARTQATALENSKTVKDLVRLERRQSDEQRRMAEPIYEQLDALKDPERRTSAMLELRKLFEELKVKAKNEKDPHAIVAKRVRTQEFIHAYENGMEMIVAKDYANALTLYDVIIANAASAPGAHLQKSKIYVLMGDRTKALSEAKLAVKDGVTDPDAFSEPEFAALKSDPEFQALLASLHPIETE